MRISLALLALVLVAGPAPAQEVWSGRDFYFEKPPYVNHTLPHSQDRITDAVWITRGNSMGIFNIAQESGYTSEHTGCSFAERRGAPPCSFAREIRASARRPRWLRFVG